MKCDRAIERIHRILDGDLMAADDRQELDSHLSACDGCRRAEAELRMIQQGLRALPAGALPDDALEAVWARTTRPPGGRLYQWGLAAAAALLAVALLSIWQFGSPHTAEPTQAELNRATDEARMVLGLTARALHTTERAAFKSVLEEEISPALKSVPIKWPGSPAGRRKNRNEI